MKKTILSTTALLALFAGSSMVQAETDHSTGAVTFNSGALTLDVGKLWFDFSANNIITGAQQLHPIVTATSDDTIDSPSLRVEDKRGTGDGWNLMLSQTKQFTGITGGSAPTNSQGKELLGATISFIPPRVTKLNNAGGEPSFLIGNTFTLIPEGSAIEIWGARNNSSIDEGMGQFALKFFEEGDDDVTQMVTLDIPASTVKYATTYKSTLEWTLNETPHQSDAIE